MNATDAAAAASSDPLVWVGFACGVLSAFGTSATLMIVKLSTQKEAHMPFCQRKLFFAGSWANLACEAGLSLFAITLTPLALLAPIQGMSLIFGAIFARLGLFGIRKEKLVRFEIFGLMATVAGISIASIFGPSGSATPHIAETTRRFLAWPHVVYGVSGWLLAGVWLVCSTFDSRFRKIRPAPEHPVTAPLSGFTSGWLAAYSMSFLKIGLNELRNATEGDLCVPPSR